MKYDIFKTKYQTIMSNKKVVKSLKKMFGRLPTYQELMIQDTQMAVELDDTLGVNTNAEEYYFERSGRKLVFVDKSVVEMLNRAKFTANKFAKILPPSGFETFAICFSKDTLLRINNQTVRLYPCLISIMEEEDMYNKVHVPFSEATGYEIARNPNLTITITVSYKIKDVTYRSCMDISEVMEKIEKEGVYQSNELSSIVDQRLDDFEQLTTNTLMKLAVQLLIFNAATDNNYLIHGYPSECKFRTPLDTNRSDWNASHIDYESDKIVSDHIRSAHFRNLQHEKYYKNKYSGMKKGSRWVLVSESFVGHNETFTQVLK